MRDLRDLRNGKNDYMIRRALLLFTGAVILSGVFTLLSIRLPVSGGDDYLSADAAVVIYGGRPRLRERFPAETERRLRYAAELDKNEDYKEIIISGGLCGHGKGSESIREISKELGIDQKVFCENLSRDTIGNLSESAEIAAKRGYDRLIVIASEWHAGRARRLFLREVRTDIDIIFKVYPYTEAFPPLTISDRIHDFFYNLAAYAAYRFLPEKIYSDLVERRSYNWNVS